MERIDLNLLQLMLILLEERSVSAAAARLHLSQSAVSKQLSKLRQQLSPRLDDPLFVRSGQGLVPTPKAQALEAPLRQWLQLSCSMLQPAQFDPLVDQRSFTVTMAETAFHTLLPLLPKLNALAPQMRLKLVPQTLEQFERLHRGQLDLLVIPRDTDNRAPYPWHLDHLPNNLSTAQLFMDGHRVLLRRDHPLLSQPWTMEAFLSAQHITIWVEGSERWLMDNVLAGVGSPRVIGAQVPDFHSAALMAQHSDMLFVCAAQFANHLMPRFGLTTLPMPLELAPISFNMLWPPSLDNDPAHQWLRRFFATYTPALLQPDTAT
ncbi:LysR family transcriptional regulator [uncultured Ferrimonas sp.]|uniref:LysR family transcriptional regulator n=1 Tax=uncultured Ferrimonas sp. TaxID=432640 RepID=UPI0026284582|nr:LysR family transcriptional regulator [uncultured Ferrimonas sp.]